MSANASAKKVYIAGPMSRGNRLANLNKGLTACRILLEAGYAPFCPMLSFFMAAFVDLDHQQWMRADLPWVRSADAVLRLDGESVGADQETALAEELGIPVFRSMDDLMQSMGCDSASGG